MNKTWFWFGIAAGFALLLFWKRGACSCSDYVVGSDVGLPSTIGGGAFNGGDATSAGNSCPCSGTDPRITSPLRPSTSGVNVRGPGSWISGGIASRPGVRAGTSIFAQDNVNNQLAGLIV